MVQEDQGGQEDKTGWEDLEQRWKVFNGLAIREGRQNIESRIKQGQHVVAEHNSVCFAEERVHLVVTIKRSHRHRGEE